MHTPNFEIPNLTGPLAELQKINQAASEEIIRETISFCSDNTGSALKYSQTMPRISSPEDYFSTQVKLFAQQGEKVLDYTQNVFQIYQDTLRKQLDWAQDQFTAAVKTAAAKGKKVSDAAN